MRMFALLAAGFLFLVAVSGCLGSDSKSTDKSASPSTSGGAGSNSTASGSGGGSTTPSSGSSPPTIDVAVSIDGSAATPANGSFAAAVGTNVSFDASASTDPDGSGPLTFAWDFGDATTGANATITHAWTAAGNYSVNVTVTDDENETNSTSLAFVVAAGSAAPAGEPDYYFLDDGDANVAKWTFQKYIVIQDPLFAQPENIVKQSHPTSVGWHTTSAEKFEGAKGWTSQDEAKKGYHDDEWTAMVSPSIDLTAAKRANLSFYLKGDAEANGYDGIYWSVSTDGGSTFTGLGQMADSKAPITLKAWTLKFADLAKYTGKKVQIRFLFKADTSCSGDTDLPAAPVLGALCGAHASYSAFFVDNIRIAPT